MSESGPIKPKLLAGLHTTKGKIDKISKYKHVFATKNPCLNGFWMNLLLKHSGMGQVSTFTLLLYCEHTGLYRMCVFFPPPLDFKIHYCLKLQFRDHETPAFTLPYAPSVRELFTVFISGGNTVSTEEEEAVKKDDPARSLCFKSHVGQL